MFKMYRNESEKEKRVIEDYLERDLGTRENKEKEVVTCLGIDRKDTCR